MHTHPYRPTLQTLREFKARAEGVLEDDLAEATAEFDDEQRSLSSALFAMGYRDQRSLYAQWHELPWWAVEAMVTADPLGGDD